MVFDESAALRDREMASYEAVQAGSKTAVNFKGPYDSIKSYTFTSANLLSNLNSGTISVYSDYPINGELKRISVVPGNWDDEGSLWLSQSGASYTPGILILISGTAVNLGVSTAKSYYPAAYPSYTNAFTADGIGSPNILMPLINTEKLKLIGSGLDLGKSGLGIIIDYY